MGIDLLEINLRIEEQFKVKMQQADWQSITRGQSRPDVTIGDLYDFIVSWRVCRTCAYDLRGHPDAGICPECGVAFMFSDQTRQADWESLRQLLSEVLGTEPDKITRDSRLIQDLGMT